MTIYNCSKYENCSNFPMMMLSMEIFPELLLISFVFSSFARNI